MARETSATGGMRRIAAPFAVLALLAVALFLALRSADERPPSAPACPAGGEASPTHRVARARAPEPATLPPRAIRVAVTSMDGTPIPGARVELFRGPAGEEWTDNEAADFRPSIVPSKPERTAAADDGDVTFGEVPSGRWFVAADAPGFGRHVAVGVSRDGDAEFVATLTLVKGTAFAGTIVDEKGAPVGDVAVILAPTWNATPWPGDAACLRTATAKDGAYRFDFVEPGEYRLWYAPQRDLLLCADRIRVPAIDRYDIAFAEGATIEGTIGDLDSGEPLAGAEVVAVQDYSSCVRESPLPVAAGRTDEHGRFSIRTWTSPCDVDTILVDDPRCASWPADGTGKVAAKALDDGQRAVVVVRVRRGATVTGAVLGTDGPIPGFRVGVHSEADWQLPGDPESEPVVVTGADGRFRFDRRPAGKARLYVSRPRGNTEELASAELSLDGGSETVHDVHVDAVRARVAYRVVDPSGAPIAGVEVVQDEGSFRATTRTDADGKFALDVQLFAGAAELTLRRDGFQTECRAIKPADADTEDWTLNPSRDAIGTVRDAGGRPVAGAHVVLLSGIPAQGTFIVMWHGLGESFSRADGKFSVPTVTQESDSLVAHRRSDGAASRAENVSNADDVEGTALVLPAMRRVAGRVVAAGSDAPVADVLVHQRYAGIGEDDVVIGRTAADGTFAVDFEPVKDGALRFERRGWIDRFVPTTEVADDLRVEPSPSLVIGGVVRFDDGAPAIGARVEATVDDGRPDSIDGTTDAAGRFLLRDLAPGSWTLAVFSEDSAIVPSRTSAVAGDRALVVVGRHAQPLKLEVVDADGAAVAKADVSVEAESDPTATDSGTTDSNGSAKLAGLADTPLVVRVGCDGFAPVERRGVRAFGDALRIVLTRKPPR